MRRVAHVNAIAEGHDLGRSVAVPRERPADARGIHALDLDFKPEGLLALGRFACPAQFSFSHGQANRLPHVRTA
jgi:hypothetical protein